MSETGIRITCRNCQGEVQPCELEDCGHAGNMDPYVHVATGSHYCTQGADNMVAEVDTA